MLGGVRHDTKTSGSYGADGGDGVRRQGGAQGHVAFGADGKVSVKADCNRGHGTWTSSAPNALHFGPLATTRAMCPPGSMSDRFLRDFGHMMSYVLKDGKLHISLMADGGIYDFEPAS
jgi:para-nitrobenzyl esterase